MIFNEYTLAGLEVTGKRYVVTDSSRTGFSIRVSSSGKGAYYYRYKTKGRRKEIPLGENFLEALAFYRNIRTSSRQGVKEQVLIEASLPAIQLSAPNAETYKPATPANTEESTSPVEQAIRDLLPEGVDVHALCRLLLNATNQSDGIAPEFVDALFYRGRDLPAIINEFMKYHVYKNLGKSAQENYGHYFDRLLEYSHRHGKSLYHGTCTVREGRQIIKSFLINTRRHTPTQSNRMCSCYSSMFKWGMSEDIVYATPVFSMPTAPEKPKGRMFSSAELKVLLPVLQAGGYEEGSKDALKLLLLTCLRSGEVLNLRPMDLLLDEKRIVIDGSRVKNGVSHLIPLTDFAKALIEKNITEDLKPTDRIFKVSSYGLRQVLVRACKRAAIKVCSPHDLRRTSATMAGSLGTPIAVIEALLNHTTKTVTSRHYMLYHYEEERREALIKLADKYTCLGMRVR